MFTKHRKIIPMREFVAIIVLSLLAIGFVDSATSTLDSKDKTITELKSLLGECSDVNNTINK